LSKAGINSLKELKKAGNENASIRIMTIDNSACLSMLYAIEGAIQEIRWHNLDKAGKNELRNFFNSVK
jgi:DNA transformation protein and related proteins